MVKTINYHIQTLPFSMHKGHPYTFEDGILMSKIPYNQGYHYHLTSIASYAIAEYPSRKSERHIEWIIDNLNNGCYYHDFDVITYDNVKAPWVGGLAQGLAISALMLYDEINVAKKVAEGLKRECVVDDIIQEYPGVTVLNGWIYAIFGLVDIFDTDFLHVTLKKLLYELPKYVNPNRPWSIYDSTGMPATTFYHRVVFEQLKILYALTKIDEFYDRSVMMFMMDNFSSRRFRDINRWIRILWKNRKHPIRRYNEYRRWKE